MMRKVVAVLFFCCLVAGMSACGPRKAGAGLDYEATSAEFFDALFGARFDEAKAMALPDFADRVRDDVDAFAQLLQKYEFRERKIISSRPWGQTGNPEGDLAAEVGYQFRAKGSEESWRIGSLQVRVLKEGGHWGIAGVKYVIPERGG